MAFLKVEEYFLNEVLFDSTLYERISFDYKTIKQHLETKKYSIYGLFFVGLSKLICQSAFSTKISARLTLYNYF